MAMHIGTAPGLTQMLLDGARLYSGVDEVVARNIEACRNLTEIVSSSYGPKGNKCSSLRVANDYSIVLHRTQQNGHYTSRKNVRHK